MKVTKFSSIKSLLSNKNNLASDAKLQSLYEIILEANIILKDATEEEKVAFVQAFIDMCEDNDACNFSEIRA